MTDSATLASRNASSGPNILERLEQISQEEPDRTEYQLTTETEAQELLTAMAAMLGKMALDVSGTDRQVLKDYEATYRVQVINNTALDYFRQLTDEDQLEFCGLKITVPVIVLQ